LVPGLDGGLRGDDAVVHFAVKRRGALAHPITALQRALIGLGAAQGAARGFRLLGAHARIACESCHSPSDWSVPFTPTGDEDCISCHTDDYQQEHAGSGFPTTCLTCHTIDTWDGASFVNHDAQFFPIYSGPHKDKWQDCQTCHVQANNFQVFSCFACHGQTKTDDQHKEEAGYRYDSNACYQCHPNGRS